MSNSSPLSLARESLPVPVHAAKDSHGILCLCYLYSPSSTVITWSKKKMGASRNSYKRVYFYMHIKGN